MYSYNERASTETTNLIVANIAKLRYTPHSQDQ